MKEISTLLKLVSSFSPGQAEHSVSKKRSLKEERFIKNIESGFYDCDEQAAADLYSSSTNDPRYKMLKHRIKSKLYNSLKFLDPDKAGLNLVRKKEFECHNLLFQANILRWKHEFELVANLATKSLIIAEQYDFTDIKVSALELLNFSYSELGAAKKFLDTQDALREVITGFMQEREAVSLFQNATIQLRKSTKNRKEFLKQLPNLITKLEKLWESSGTFSAFNSFYRTYIMYHELEGNFQMIINITLDALKQVNENKVNRFRFDSMYNNYIMIYAHLRAKDYVNGIAHAEKNLPLYSPSSRNWFAYMENYFLLAVHARQYELGDSLQRQVFNNSAFNTTIPTIAKERWLLYRTYFKLVYPAAAAKEGEAKNPYLLSLPEYSKDKLGFNVAILTLQFIYLLEKGETEALLYRIESIKKYVSTHLKDVFSLRSKLFLKLLVLTVTEDYDAIECRRKGETLYRKLIDTPAPGDAYAEIEIVPYEHLWDLILDILERVEGKVDIRNR
jgi:hypothetical protein